MIWKLLRIILQKVKEEPFEKDDEKKLNFVYRVIVKNDDVSKNLIEIWKDQHNSRSELKSQEDLTSSFLGDIPFCKISKYGAFHMLYVVL